MPTKSAAEAKEAAKAHLSGEPTTNTAAASTESKREYAPRVEPTILGISSNVPMPSRATSRGSKSAYDFAALTAVGMSIAVGNKSAAQLSSVVTNANKKAVKEGSKPVLNADGTPAFQMNEMKDAAGNVIGSVPDPTKPLMTEVPHYFAVDCDPNTDPDKATARIFRNK